MKKVIFVLVLALFVFEGKSQLTDAQLISQADTIKYETKAGANTAIRVGRMFENIIYNKINSSYFIDSTKIPYLAKPNNFTGSVDSFQTIVTSGTANIGGSLTVDNTIIPYFSGDTTLSAAGGGAVPIMSAVKAYVTNHSSGGSFIDTSKIPYLAKTNKFTGIDSFATTVSNTLSIIDSVPKLNNSADTIASRSYVRNYSQSLSNLSNSVIADSASTTKYPSVRAAKRYIDSITNTNYTEYKALLYQTSTNAPKDTVVFSNNTGRTFTYNYISSGYYFINISGSAISQNKITILMGGAKSPTGSFGMVNCWNNSGGIYTGYLIQTSIINSGTFAFTDGLLYFTPITIRIYN